jgi:hypothetical protein
MTYPKKDQYGRPRTPYAIYCTSGPLEGYSGCGLVYLTDNEYNQQMMRPNATWRCPICGMYPARWDDDNYEQFGENDDNV